MESPSILHPLVDKTVTSCGLDARQIPCDPGSADTADFVKKYGYTLEQSANTIIVASRKIEPTQYAVCVVLASTKLDVNKKAVQLLGVKKASFADMETTVQLTGMEIGGVTAVGIENLPIYVDKAVMGQEKVVMGGGNRASKLVISPKQLLLLPNCAVVNGLAK